MHASLTLSKETLERCVELCPEDIGFHIHAAEGVADEVDSLDKSGKRVIFRLDELGILRPQTILAHGVHFNEQEIERLALRRSWLTHQPRSNMNNAVGVAPIEDMLSAGVRVGMGNDGFSNTMWQEWKEAYLLQKLAHGDPRRMGGYAITQIAVENNSDLITELFDNIRVGNNPDRRSCRPDLCGLSSLYGADPWQPPLAYPVRLSGEHGHGNDCRRETAHVQRELLTMDESEIAAKPWKPQKASGSVLKPSVNRNEMTPMSDAIKQKYTLGIIGGTGQEGKGLAYRWAEAGHHVIIGSVTRKKPGCRGRDRAFIGGGRRFIGRNGKQRGSEGL